MKLARMPPPQWRHLAVPLLEKKQGGHRAIGIFASSLVRTQVAAIVFSGFMISMLVLIFHLAGVVEPPFSTLFENLALYNKHMPPFHEGLLRFEHLAYFVSVTWLFLTLATQVLRWRRWQ